jgi:hypothetical protein
MSHRLNSLKRSAFTLAACLVLTACAPHRPVQSDLRSGQLGRILMPDCKLNPATATVKCACDTFDLALDGKSGKSVLRCPENSAK